MSLICFWIVRKVSTFRSAQLTMLAWEFGAAVGVAAGVSSQQTWRLFVVLLLPSIYYLVVPTSLRWTVIAGASCSILLLAGYLLPVSGEPDRYGPRVCHHHIEPCVAAREVTAGLTGCSGPSGCAGGARGQRGAYHQPGDVAETMFKRSRLRWW